MHLQILASGSQGNSALVRAGDTHVLVDAGLLADDLAQRLDAARVSPRQIDHLVLTHGHLDHARGAGRFSERYKVAVHCADALASNRSLRRSHRIHVFTVGRVFVVTGPLGLDPVAVRPVLIPHDARPTVAFRLEHEGRVAVVVTDMGRPDNDAARGLLGAHLLLLEFNHDVELLARGPYTPQLKRRVGGPHGHLSNEQAAQVLRALAGPELHTLVLAHLSLVNNTPELAREAAERALGGLGRGDVRIVVADQEVVGPNLRV